MTRFAPLLVVSWMAFGCGGSAPAPAARQPANPTPPPALAPADAPAAAADKPAADGWEGEGEAKGASSTPAAAPKPTAAPNTKAGVTETRTIEVIQKLVKEHRQPVRDCFDKARKDLPSLQGDVMIHFVLDPDGKVKTIELNQERSTLKNPDVVNCAIATIKGISFPPSSRGMESVVNYPYNFTPGGPPQH